MQIEAYNNRAESNMMVYINMRNKGIEQEVTSRYKQIIKR